MLSNIKRIGELGVSLVVQAKQAFARRDVGLAQDLVSSGRRDQPA